MDTQLATIKDLETHLKQFGTFSGSWVKKPSGYENEFSKIIGAIPNEIKDDRKYCDCIWHGLKIEIKKGKGHSFLNPIRYCSYITEGRDKSVVTLFLFYENDKITSIYGLDIPKILEILGLDESPSGVKTVKHLEFIKDKFRGITTAFLVAKKDVDKSNDFSIIF